MRLVLLLFPVLAWAAPTVSNIETVRTTHSSISIKFLVSGSSTHYRVRYGPTTAYEGTGTPPGESGIQELQGYDTPIAAVRLEARIGGLKPDTEYHLCPQVSDDNKATWSTCVDHTASTTAVPAGDHPAKPTAPTAVTTARPDTSGYDVRAVASDCSDLQSKIDAAAANQYTNGSIITIPAGTVCTGNYDLKGPGTLKTWSAANVNTATNRVTITGHGLNDGDAVFTSVYQSPGSAGYDTFRQWRGALPYGSLVYVRVIDENTVSFALTPDGSAISFSSTTLTADDGADTLITTNERFVPLDGTAVQFVGTDLPDPLAQNTTYYVRDRNQAARSFKVAATGGGAAIDLTDEGSGTYSLADQGTTGYLVKWPVPNWIIIRTATADSAFVPEGVRVTPEFQSKMATIRTSNKSLHTIGNAELATKYRFEGIEVTHSDTATAEFATTINPAYFSRLIYLQRNTANIIFDRCYIHGLGAPNRIYSAIAGFDSHDSAIMNSYLDDLEYWMPVREGMTLTRNGDTEFTIAAGTFHLPADSCTIGSTVTVTLSGSASGTATGRAYCTRAGALTLDLPTGVSASCSPAVCTVQNSASPAYPLNGDSRSTVMPIGDLSFTDAALTAVSAPALSSPFADWVTGSPVFLAGAIGGKTALINNTLSAAGAPPWHYDDNNDNQTPGKGDYTITRNLFTIPVEKVFSQAGSNKLGYGQRQLLEWKSGQRIKIRGNIFEHVFSEATAVANAITISPTQGPNSAITDVEVGYNLFRNGSGGLSIGGGRVDFKYAHTNADTRPANPTMQRVWVHNNLFYGLNQYTWRAYSGANAGNYSIDHRYVFEDSIWEHNTFYDLRGTSPATALFGGPSHEGLIVRNNIFWNNDALMFRSDECADNVPACSGDGDALTEDLSWNDVWEGNSFIAGWTDETGTTAKSSKTYLTGAMPGADSYLQSELADDIEWVDAANGDFRLKPGVTHRSGGAKKGTDGRDRGVDYNKLRQEIGEIYNIRVLSITSSAATIYATVPDSGASCYVGYGTTSDPSGWDWTAANTAASRVRGIAVSGLTTATEYHYRLVCAGTYQPATGTFTTN